VWPPVGCLPMRERGPVVTAKLAILVAAMRAGGARLGIGDLLNAHRALAAVDASSPADSYLALRAALCSRHDDLEVFDAAFDATFGALPRDTSPPVELPDAARLVVPRVAVPPSSAPRVGDSPDGAEPVPAAWSEVELLREKDFAEMTDGERASARRLVRRLALRGPLKRSRRTRVSRRRGAHTDLRATVRASMRYGGEPIERRWRQPATKHRPVVFVCDVSGSMEPYARMLVVYMQAWVAARRRVEAFAFGTRLTRITRELAGRDADAAVARAAHAATDWSGGTRIGESLAELNRAHGRRLGRGAVVVLLSDGWDRGEPQQLLEEMARLQRCAHSLIWLNPLKAHEGYEPLTRGMRTALPYVDHFLAGNSIASLEELAELMEGGLA
jgi:uncharacterized protein with von Willebrand factor type A (vWA) domain